MKNFLLIFFGLSACLAGRPVFSQTGGPWDHKVCMAYSTNGINFTRDTNFLISPGSVPDAVMDTSETIFLYYVKMDSAGDTEKLMVATSFDGEYFSTPQLTNISGTTVSRRVDPCAVLLPDGRIRLYYIDFDMMPPQEVHSAISNDGINFTEEPGTRYSDPTGITDPDVFFNGSLWNMYLSKGTQLVRSTSSDGLTYNADTNFTWSGGAVCSTVQLSCGLYKTYYCGNGIQTANSPNGASLIPENNICFTPEPNEIVCDPSVIRLISGEFLMYFKSFTITSIDEYNCYSCGTELKNYPNPFSQSTTISIPENLMGKSQKIKIDMYDYTGRIFSSKDYFSSDKIKIKNENMPSGIYFYQIKSNGKFIGKGRLEVIK